MKKYWVIVIISMVVCCSSVMASETLPHIGTKEEIAALKEQCEVLSTPQKPRLYKEGVLKDVDLEPLPKDMPVDFIDRKTARVLYVTFDINEAKLLKAGFHREINVLLALKKKYIIGNSYGICMTQTISGGKKQWAISDFQNSINEIIQIGE